MFFWKYQAIFREQRGYWKYKKDDHKEGVADRESEEGKNGIWRVIIRFDWRHLKSSFVVKKKSRMTGIFALVVVETKDWISIRWKKNHWYFQLVLFGKLTWLCVILFPRNFVYATPKERGTHKVKYLCVYLFLSLLVWEFATQKALLSSQTVFHNEKQNKTKRPQTLSNIDLELLKHLLQKMFLVVLCPFK
jgi:hypothetical protein